MVRRVDIRDVAPPWIAMGGTLLSYLVLLSIMFVVLFLLPYVLFVVV